MNHIIRLGRAIFAFAFVSILALQTSLAAEMTPSVVPEICPCEAQEIDGLLPVGPLLSPEQIKAVDRINATGTPRHISDRKVNVPKDNDGHSAPTSVHII